MIYRSEQWLQAVRSLGACVLCGRPDVQAAHRNEGKGMAVKVDDCAAACLCVSCHWGIDQGVNLSRESRRALMDRAIVLTVIELARRRMLVPFPIPAAEVGPPRIRVKRRPSKGRTASPSKIIPHSGRPL